MYLDKQSPELAQSSHLFFSLLTNKNVNMVDPPPQYAKNADFDVNFPGKFINSPTFINCRFNGSIFDSPAGESTNLESCGFFDCTLHNGDFRYCNFQDTIFTSKHGQSLIDICNFSYGNFIGTRFVQTTLTRNSFRGMLIDSCSFQDCQFDSSGFERSNIRNCNFVNLDFSKIVFRFCNFDNVQFSNVTIHILDLAKNSGLIEQLSKVPSEVKIFYGDGKFTSLEEALFKLPGLTPYYLSNKEYYYAINILAMQNRLEEVWALLPDAFNHVIWTKNFAALQDLCSLIARIKKYNETQLQELYNIIKKQTVPEKLPYHQLKSYSTYMENIKSILLENPHGYPSATITIGTNVLPNNMDQLAPLLKAVETNLHDLLPEVAPRIQITHHSPYDVIIFLYATLPELLRVCQMFYYTFGGLKSLKDIASSRHEKAIRQPKVPETNAIVTKKNIKKKTVSLSIRGFHYQKECETLVESVEYLIT